MSFNFRYNMKVKSSSDEYFTLNLCWYSLINSRKWIACWWAQREIHNMLVDKSAFDDGGMRVHAWGASVGELERDERRAIISSCEHRLHRWRANTKWGARQRNQCHAAKSASHTWKRERERENFCWRARHLAPCSFSLSPFVNQLTHPPTHDSVPQLHYPFLRYWPQ